MTMAESGIMYIETSAMLNTFDGVSIKSMRYDLDKIPYTEYNGMKEIYLDARERLWVKSRDNTFVYDINRDEFIYDIDSLGVEIGVECHIDNIFIIEPEVYLIYSDEQHTIYCYNDNTKESNKISLPPIVDRPISITTIGDSLWILSNNGQLLQWDSDSNSIIYVERNIISKSDREVLSRVKMVADNRHQLWIITDNEVRCYDTTRYNRSKQIDTSIDDTDIFTCIAFDKNEHIWIGSSKSGVRRINNETFEVEHLPYLEVIGGNNVEHNTDISQIYADDRGGVWIATETEGLLYHHRDIFKLEVVNNTTLSSGELKDLNVKCMLNEPDGTILLGTVNGLFRYDPKSNSVTLPYDELSSVICVGLYRDNNDRVWLGTFHSGAFCIDRGEIRHYVYPDMPDINISYLNSTPNLNSIRTFYHTPTNEMYIGVYGGVGVLDEQSGNIELIKEVEGSKSFITRGITPLSDGRLIITGENGVFTYDQSRRVVDNNLPSLPLNSISCYDLTIDSRGLIWIATLDGLVIYEPTSSKYRVLRREDGLSSNKILSVLEDDFNNIWITTSSGISAIKMREKWELSDVMIINFTHSDGLADTSFFHHSSIKGDDGKLYFGSSNGMCVVEPSSINNSSNRSKPTLLNLRLYNRSTDVGGNLFGSETLNRELDKTTQLELKHNESPITFEFSTLNYSNPNHNQYRYMLENFDNDWVEIRDLNNVASATFSLLNPGKYRFKVQSASNGGWWSDESMEIELTVLPPWWSSRFAIVTYILLLLAVIYGIVSSIISRNYQETLKRQAIEEERRKEEMEEMKLRFFVNVSHELRTPLSLIIIPLESLLSKVADPQIKPQLETMRRNAKSLLQLVNHLLDFRKIDMDHERLKPSAGDMNAFVEAIFETFRSTAEVNMINLTFESNHSRLPMSFDHGMMQKILNNLLSNAMKFTPQGGSVTVSLRKIEVDGQRPYAEIKVCDTGKGIPQKDVDFIFDRFFQASNNSDSKGTGIGLNLTKIYTELHGGEISVESRLGSGSTFMVSIPMDIEPEEVAAESVIEAEPEIATDQEKRYRLLIVEDNRDFREYMVSELSETYDIMTAENGYQGLDAIKESMPDLIMSDVMMPEMDGLELCHALKSNIETSHIPIILLTAHSSDESRLSSYESGADAYISKPFHWGVLQARIRNLIEERKKRVQSFNSTTESDLETLTLAPIDEKFLRRAIESIERNMDNTEYSVETMCDDLSMNRMSIYRKFKSIMEQTPAEFIRTIRIKRAAKWIESGKGRGYSLTEISEMFGFNTPKYFSKYFKEIYGETPMQYISRFKER